MPATKRNQETVTSDCTFPPEGYQPTPLNALLANALDLSAPASVALVKNRKTAWIQLAGHPGFFAPAGPKTIWKKQESYEKSEARIYRSLMYDSVASVVPKLYREVQYNGSIFIEIEDLLQHFHDPNIMDIKMGTRTFMESEVSNPQLRCDLYEKMIKIDANAPTAAERSQRAVTKLRYMQYREQGSSTATLGFRIDAIRLSGQPANTNFKSLASKEQIMSTIKEFICGRRIICEKLLTRFAEIREQFAASRYFQHRELIGSSLLVLYDEHDLASAWIIDFAKTVLVPDRIVKHCDVWQPGNHEDGYLTGLDNLVDIMKKLLTAIDVDTSADTQTSTADSAS